MRRRERPRRLSLVVLAINRTEMTKMIPAKTARKGANIDPPRDLNAVIVALIRLTLFV